MDVDGPIEEVNDLPLVKVSVESKFHSPAMLLNFSTKFW